MSRPESKAKQRARMSMLAGRISECARTMDRVADEMHEVALRIERKDISDHAKELHGASVMVLSWVRVIREEIGI